MARALLRGSVETRDILLSLGIMLLSILGSGLIKAKSTMLQTEAGYDTCAKKRVEIAEHMRYLPMGYFNENSLGQITSVTTNVMENLENVATRVVMLVCEGLLTTSLIIVMLFFFDWRIALVLLAGFALFLLENTFLQKAAGKLAGKKIKADEKLVEKVLEYLQGMAEVKAYHLTGAKSRELNDAISANAQINTDMEVTFIPRLTAQNFIAKLTGVCMVGFSCAFFCAGSMDALTAVVMVISAFIVYASLETAGNYSALLRVVEVSVNRAQEILDTPQMDISGEVIAPETRELRADAVEFSYEKRKVIDGISLQIPEKTTTAIVGPSGGGKTTLVNLLARFWDVDAGSVALGGRNVKDYDMDSLMANFSFVFQNVYLFHDTIANNIRFGRPLHHGAAGGLRHGDRRGRRQPLRRGEAAHLHCPRHDEGRAGDLPGRGHGQRGPGERKRAHAGHPGADGGKDRHHDRPPAENRGACRPDPGDRPREDRPAGES